MEEEEPVLLRPNTPDPHGSDGIPLQSQHLAPALLDHRPLPVPLVLLLRLHRLSNLLRLRLSAFTHEYASQRLKVALPLLWEMAMIDQLVNILSTKAEQTKTPMLSMKSFLPSTCVSEEPSGVLIMWQGTRNFTSWKMLDLEVSRQLKLASLQV